MELRDFVNLFIVLAAILGPLIFKKSQDAAKKQQGAAPRPQPRPQPQPQPQPGRRESGPTRKSAGDDLLRKLEEEFFGGKARRAPVEPGVPSTPTESPREAPRERPPPPPRPPREPRPAPEPRPASRANPRLSASVRRTLRNLDAAAMTAPKKLPPRRQHRRRPRAAATASSASTGTSTARGALNHLRDGGSSALRTAILYRILLEPPPGLQGPGRALPELPSPPARHPQEI